MREAWGFSDSPVFASSAVGGWTGLLGDGFHLFGVATAASRVS